MSDQLSDTEPAERAISRGLRGPGPRPRHL